MQKIEIAKVLKPQGIKGEIKVELFLTDLNFWRYIKTFEIDGKVFNVTSFRSQKNFGFIGTSEITTRNEAETFRNKILKADKPDNNEEGEYFIEDLENLCVVDEGDNILGYIESVEKYSSVPNINITKNGGVRTFPFLKSVIKKVDLENKKVVVFKDKLDEVIVWRLMF